MIRSPRRLLAVALAAMFLVTAFAAPSLADGPADTRPAAATPGQTPCPAGAPERTYSVTALPLPLSYNHWGDMDLKGRLFVTAADRDALLDDVSEKLSRAGLGELAEPVIAMRDAFRAEDVPAATLAAQALVDAAVADDLSGVPRGRFDTSELVQPLVLRAYIGECVTVRLLNVMPEEGSIHVNTLRTAPGAGAAVGLQMPDLTHPGETRAYRMYIPPHANMEGAHFLTSHADPRDQIRHGLFGAIVAEPVGSAWLSTKDGQTPAPTGLEAMIVMPGRPDFREFIKIYHDSIDLVDMNLDPLPVISEYGEYGPGTKGISLRTEPFMDRFQYQDELQDNGVLQREHDKSQSYGSYTYGDPATIIQQSYLSDPVKFRLLNAGPGQHHMHHLHGGGIRWRSSPLVGDTQFDIGLTKDNPIQAAPSQRLDVQNVGPGESFNLEPEGGSGGVQQGAGDYLYHCHIAEHYLAGMWSLWRVYNTIQPDLAELPDRTGRHAPAVNSTALIGLTVADGTVLDASNLAAWVEPKLPARGVPGEEDASVYDWSVTTTGGVALYLNEPETSHVWPNYKADAPGRIASGERPEIGFDPNTGKLAYPLLKPHLGARPPFAPTHGPAPFLAGDASSTNPDGLCPADARKLTYNVVSVQAKVPFNKFDTDENGQVLVRAEDRAAAQAVGGTPTSLVLRANAGDCVDVTLVNALDEKGRGDSRQGVHTKTNIHIHLVQFDVQASDGVVTGYNYETTVRSLSDSALGLDSRDPSAPVIAKIAAGGVTISGAQTVIAVGDVGAFLDRTGAPKIGSNVGIGLGLPTIEQARLVAVDTVAKTITLDRVMANAHGVDEFIGYEFVNYRWFPDVELGVVYFHDHVNGLDTWRHGLFGSLVVEPRQSRWLDPIRVDDNVADSPVAHVVDIIPGDGSPAYREIVLHFNDRACVAAASQCLDSVVPLMPNAVTEPAAFNLRSEPLHRRNNEHPFWSSALYGADDADTLIDERTLVQGDPGTMALQAYPGDRVVIRFLYAGHSMSRAVGNFGVTGHRFQQEQFLTDGRTTNSLSASISGQHNLELECGAGGCLNLPGDYMYWMTQPEYVNRGAWGLMRVLDPADGTPIRPLASNLAPVAGALPAGAPVRHYDVAAVESLVANNPNFGITSTIRHFIPLPNDTNDTNTPVGVPAGIAPPDPLVMRALPGEIVEVTLTNRMGTGRVGLTPAMLAASPANQGVNVGNGPAATIGPGETITYRWYAEREIGVIDLVSLADPVNDAQNGLTGALIIEPAGSSFADGMGVATDITLPGGRGVAREQVLLFSTEDGQFESSTMPYLPDVRGLSLINYATEPLTRRSGVPVEVNGGTVGGTSIHTCQIDSAGCLDRPTEVRGPGVPLATSGVAPWTPIIEANLGQPLILRVVGAAGDQLQVFHLDGHAFATDPDMDDCKYVLATCHSNVVSSVTIGAREARNIWIPSAGPGGSGDYLYRNGRDAFFEGGQWGLLRVLPPPPVEDGALPVTIPTL